MWPFAVIQHQIFSHSLIKQIQVLKKQQFIEFNKLFSKCPVKSLTGRRRFADETAGMIGRVSCPT